MLAADNWCVKVDDRIYGPYSSQQLRKFAHEGRLAAWSLVAPAGSRTWRAAREEVAFAAFFGEEATSSAASVRRFGKRDCSEAAEPRAESKTKAAGSRAATDRSHSAGPAEMDAAIANFIIIFDVVSAAASRVETSILSLGQGFRVAENVWALTCELTAIGVRNAIAPYLLPRESILVIDTTRGRTSWQNHPPEIHAKLAAAWSKTR